MPTRSRNESSRLHAAGSRTEPQRQLNDTQWFLISDLMPDPPPNPLGGRPPHKNRDCFEGILFVLITGCRWKDLPSHFPSESVCHARFKLWVEQGVFLQAWERLLELKALYVLANAATTISLFAFLCGLATLRHNSLIRDNPFYPFHPCSIS